MRFISLLWTASVFAMAQAQLDVLSTIPSCPLSCILEFVPQTGCSLTDIACLCRDEQLFSNATTCSLENCSLRDGLTAQKISMTACGAPVRDNRAALYSVGPAFGAFALIVVLIRVVARRPGKSGALWWDDAMVVLSTLIAIPAAILDIILAQKGLGTDIWMVSYDDITAVLRLFYAGSLLYVLNTALVKIAVLCLYLRVFPSKQFRRVCFATIGLCVSFEIAFIFPLAFQCKPVAYAWNRWDGEHKGVCIDLNAGTWTHAAINMALDLLVMLLPIPLLIHLSLSRRKKMQIMVMFLVGIFATIVSIIRLQSLVRFANSDNPTWDYTGIAIWSHVEVFASIICVCIPSLRLFLERILPGWLGLHSTVQESTQKLSSDHRERSSVANHTISEIPKHMMGKRTTLQDSEYLRMADLESDQSVQGGGGPKQQLHC